MSVKDVAGAACVGLLAGAAGTAAMTASNLVEMKLVTGRSGSTTPADAVSEVTGVEPASEEGKQRLNELSHWAYGIGQGAVRGLIGAAGLSGPAAAAVHFGAVWAAQQTLMPALGVGSPTWRYGGQAIAIDVTHHAVYAAATSAAYEWLDSRLT